MNINWKANGPTPESTPFEYYERVMKILDLVREVKAPEKVIEVFDLLRGSEPRGDHWDLVKASDKQIAYITRLANLSNEQLDYFIWIEKESGGLKMAHAGHMIEVLKEKRKSAPVENLMRPNLDGITVNQAVLLRALCEVPHEGWIGLDDAVRAVNDLGLLASPVKGGWVAGCGRFLVRRGLVLYDKAVKDEERRSVRSPRIALAPGVGGMLDGAVDLARHVSWLHRPELEELGLDRI